MISSTLKIPHDLAIDAIFLVLFSRVFSSVNEESGIAMDSFISCFVNTRLKIYFCSDGYFIFAWSENSFIFSSLMNLNSFESDLICDILICSISLLPPFEF